MIPTLLDIQNLHVLSGDGQTADYRRVRCPVHHRTVAFDRCLACADSGGVTRDVAGHAEFASCRHAPVEPPRAARPAAGDGTSVAAVMTTEVFAVTPDVSLDLVADFLLERGVGAAPVVDGEGRPLGVVSRSDLLEHRVVAGDTGEATAPGWQASRGRYRLPPGPGVHAEEPPPGSVADAMTRAAVTVSEQASIEAAAEKMVTRGIHRVLVVSDDGTLSGIVTSSDVMRWVAASARGPAAKA